MSAAEETIGRREAVKSRTKPIGDRVLDRMSSVRLGVIFLCALVALSMIGMLIIQQNVDGFDSYYASLTPAEKMVYGYLGFFDIYYSWYFKLLLLALSLNIILASIDHWETMWKHYFSQPKFTATRDWLMNQPQNAVIADQAGDSNAIADKVSAVFTKNGLKSRVTSFETTSYPTNE